MARARRGELTSGEMAGATFTVSNLGMFGVTAFQAIVTPPQAAILAVGAIERRPAAVGDDVLLRHRMTITLSADHRIVDGAMAAKFLRHVGELLEVPDSL